MIQYFIKKVGEFHDAFGVKRGNVDVELRYKLFKEEFDEYKDAKTLVDKADAIVDMLYIACGTLDVYKAGVKFKHNRNELNTKDKEECLYYIEKHLEKYLETGIYNHTIHLIKHTLDLAKRDFIYDKLPQLFEEVHLSNLSKLDENGKPIINDGILDPSKPIGKILKGKNYFEPRLKEILENGN